MKSGRAGWRGFAHKREHATAQRAQRVARSLPLVVAGLALLAACGSPGKRAAPLPLVRDTPTASVVVGVTGRGLNVASATQAPTEQTTIFPEELLVGQRIAGDGTYDKTETEGAGPMVCRIERDSCAFAQLARYPSSDILFSNSEASPYDDEDALMHPDMVLPLQRLAALVEAEWGGEVKVMVTETYDSLLEHDAAQPDAARKYSLHFEGRSIDFIPWPAELRYMSRLCALAYHAGFDWVHNEENHCHASIRADSLCDICSGEASQ